MLTTLSVIGTRPEAIKMAPVLKQLMQRSDEVRSIVCVTGQHREMLNQVLSVFEITPDYDLAVMRPDQTLSEVTGAIINGLDQVISKVRPQWVLVQGDTTTVMAASLVAFYHRILVAHIEAGLRTHDKHRPYPEEINRRITDVIADLFFAPTQRARQNLLNEGVKDSAIRVTGNTVVDALLNVAAKTFNWTNSPLACIPQDRRLVLVTAHRREHFGCGMREVCFAIKGLAQRYRNECHFVYPVHLNSNVRKPVYEILACETNVSLIEPLDYVALIQLMKRATLILTDSGGIQEEAPSLGVPVLVMRDTTERPEGVEAGTARLVGTDRVCIMTEASNLLDNPLACAEMSGRANPYGDGRAAQRIVESIISYGTANMPESPSYDFAPSR
jgi:UDP-N-acetylglucosamine 2-epimerase (non-hydrolysing)